MATTSKDIYAADIYAADIYAAGVWRGTAVAEPVTPEWTLGDLFWDMLEADPVFAAAVPEDSRIKYTSTTKRTIEPHDGHAADFPRVRVRMIGSHPWHWRTTNGCCNVMFWQVDIESGDRRMSTSDANKFDDVKFAIYRAMSRWKDYLWDFTWGDDDNPGKVRRFISVETGDTVGPNQEADSPLGWTSVWRGEMEVWYTTSDLVG